MGNPSVTDSRTLAEGRFVALKALAWTDSNGVARQWESAERVADAGAVLIIPRLEPSGRILLIRQYRPPARRMVIEFPAGLVDKGEDAGAAGARELREETGYHAAKLVVTSPAYTTPGLSNEAVHMVLATIDENAPENKCLETEFDPSENIESILVPQAKLPEFYFRETARGTAFDAKLAAFILSMTL